MQIKATANAFRSSPSKTPIGEGPGLTVKTDVKAGLVPAGGAWVVVGLIVKFVTGNW